MLNTRNFAFQFPLLLLSFVFISQTLLAQPIWRKEIEQLNNNNNTVYDVDICSNGDYIWAGNTGENGFGAFQGMRTDNSGTIKWITNVVGGNCYRYGNSVVALADGSTIVGGRVYVLSNQHSYAGLVRFDENGDTLWTKYWKSLSGSNDYQNVNDMLLLADGNILVAGFSSNNNYATLTKIDTNGNTIWANHHVNGSNLTSINRIIELSSGSIMVCGHSNSIAYVAKLSSIGNSQWAKTFANLGETAHTLREISDGTVLVTGQKDVSSKDHVSLMKIDTSGTVQWAKYYVQGNNYHSRAFTIVENGSGGLILVGDENNGSRPCLISLSSTGGFNQGRNYYDFSSWGNDARQAVKDVDGGWVWAWDVGMIKFRDDFSTCFGSASSYTENTMTVTGSTISLTHNSYSADTNITTFLTVGEAEITTHCGGKCNIIDNHSAGFNLSERVVCKDWEVTISNASVSDVSRIWYENGAQVDTSQSFTREYDSAGTYNIMLVTTNAFGCKDTAEAFITVKQGCGNSSQPVSSWYRRFDNYAKNYAPSVWPNSDGGWFQTGRYYPGSGSAILDITKYDKDGTIIWSNYYGLNSVTSPRIVVGTKDGGALAVGEGGNMLFLVKVDSTGNFSWSKHYQAFNNSNLQQDIYDVRELSDGSFVLCGSGNGSGTYEHGLIFKVDLAGNLLWARHQKVDNKRTQWKNITPLPNGDLLIFGTIWESPYYGVITKLDTMGNHIWTYRAGCRDIASATILADGNIGLVGNVNNPQQSGYWVMGLWKITPDADQIWGKYYKYGSNYGFRGQNIVATNDGGVVIGGDGSVSGGGWIKTDEFGHIMDSRVGLVDDKNTNSLRPTGDGGFLSSRYDQYNDRVWIAKVKVDNEIGTCFGNATMTEWPSGISLTSISVEFDSTLLLNPQPFTTLPTTHPLTQNCYDDGCDLNSTFTNADSTCTGSPHTFTNTTSNATSYTWKVDGTQVGTTANLTHIFPNVGNYQVQLTTSDSWGCIDSSITTVVVSTGISGTAGTTTTINCGDSTQLSASGGTTYSWSPTTGLSNANIANPWAKPLSTTSYVCTISDGQCTVLDTVVITVTGGLTFTLTGTDSICTGDTAVLVASGAASYSWTPGGMTTATVSVMPSTTTTYSVTGTSGNCSATESITVNVGTIPTVSAGSYNPVCDSDNPVTLSTGSPSGGNWSGTGVSGSTFDPATAGAGSHTLTYDYTNNDGCSASATTSITVNAAPAVNVSPIPGVCKGSSSFPLTGASPSGGSWTGTGVSAGQFNPVIAGVGTHTVTYTVVGGNNCTGSGSTTVTVHDLPTVSAGTYANVCVNASPVLLNQGSPAGGSWSGGPPVNNGFFNPAVAGVGPWGLAYSYTDSNGCFKFANTTITVDSLPTVSVGTFNDVCVNASPFQLTGGSPGGGTWSGAGVSGGFFNPNSAGAGTHLISYTFQDGNGCFGTANTSIVVHALPTVTINNLNDVCTNTTPFTITAGSPAGGTWFGNGVSNNIFSPLSAGLGTHSLTYIYTDNNNCSNSATDNITVFNPPTASFQITAPVCSSDPPFTMTGGTPAGGNYTGTGLTNNVFDPGATGAGTFGITYTYTDTIGCTATDADSIVVVQGPNVSIDSLSPMCEDALPVNLTGSPANGTFSGTGVNGAQFEPQTAGPGTHKVYYSYTDSSCTGTDSTDVVVNAKPTITFTQINPFCSNDSATTLTHASPAGGTWQAQGVTGSTFDPSIPTPGQVPATYSYTDSNGCFQKGFDTLTVNAAPPIPTITQVGDSLQSSSTTGNQWYLAGSAINGATGEFYEPTQNGSYTVTVTDGNNCSETSTAYNFVLNGIENILTSGSWQVYPNPTTGKFIIDIHTQEAGELKVELINGLGQIIFTEEIENFSGDLNQKFDPGSLPAGAYLVRLQSNGIGGSKSIIIRK